MGEEYRHIWLENMLTIDEIVAMMENCDKDCENCTKEERNDCLLEMRESIHSLAISFKNAIHSFLLLCNIENNRKMPVYHK